MLCKSMLWSHRLIVSYRLSVRGTGKAKRTRQQQSAGPDGYVATLLYPSYADFLFKKALVNSFAGMTNKSELTQVDKYYFFTTVAPST
jgi:hypothetical protein